MKISVVVNTCNEAEALPRAVASVKDLASEIVVIDMESTDGSSEVAKKLGAKVFTHKRIDYVEPARNFGISKAMGDWILILDPDEEIPDSLVKQIKSLVQQSKADYYRLPRKNLIFGHFMRHTRWWPDYNIRLFKKGKVSWNEVIHGVPMTLGVGAEVKAEEDLAIIHHNYENIDEYLERMARYTKVQSDNLIKGGYKFNWKDLIGKPMGEFLGRYFVGEGYKDGIHGLTLSLLQAYSELVTYIRVWGKAKYFEEPIEKKQAIGEIEKNIKELNWWIRKEFPWLKFPRLF